MFQAGYAIVFLVIGGALLIKNIFPQVAKKAQVIIPSLVISLLLTNFSFAIAGLIRDIYYSLRHLF